MSQGHTPTSTTYRRLFDLSEGGMGQVQLVLRSEGAFARLYALKRLLPQLRGDEAAREMFIEEGRLAGLILHPNVIGVSDVGEDDAGPFLVMEYIDGVSARDLVANAARTGIPLPVELCCAVAAQVARGLECAHGLRSHKGTPLNLVHRDVSPHNIMIGFDGVVRLADFGIARALGREHRTSTGVLKGKLGYMSPEVLQFQIPDFRSDLFSFGIVLFELLSSRRLYGGKDDRVRARAILADPPPDIGDERLDVPPVLNELLISLLAKQPADRPPSARDVAERLEECADQLKDTRPIDIGVFVSEAFARVRQERTSRIEAALREIEDESAASVDPSSEDIPIVMDEGSGLRARLVMLGVALTAVSLIGMGFVWAQPSPSAARPFEKTLLAQATVEIALTTDPPGASAWASGVEARQTPTAILLPQADQPVEFHFDLDGYVPATETIVPDSDVRIRVRLTPITTVTAPTPVRERTGLRSRMRRRDMSVRMETTIPLFED